MKMHSVLDTTMKSMKIFFSVGRLMKQSTVLGHGSCEHLVNLEEKSQIKARTKRRHQIVNMMLCALPGQIISMVYPVQDVEKGRVEASF